jgi:hypothetical protein
VPIIDRASVIPYHYRASVVPTIIGPTTIGFIMPTIVGTTIIDFIVPSVIGLPLYLLL